MSVVPVARADWLRVAGGLLDPGFYTGQAKPTGGGYGWYVERVKAEVDRAQEESGERVLLIGHSAGGWLARAALGDGEWNTEGVRSCERVCGLVTIGAIHRPPADAGTCVTRGALGYVDACYPGAFLADEGVGYVSVGGDAILGDASREGASDADAASRKVDLGGIKYDRCRRLLIGWMLTQTGVIRQACALVALLKEELPLAAERASAYYPAPAADVTAEPSKAELGAAEATAQLAERCTEILTERGASMCAGSLQVVWSAAESLATQMQYEGIVGFMAGAELLLAATPQADPRFLSSSASAALSEAHVMQICTHLSEEAMQWLRSRSDAAAITSCLRVQQSRALSRAAGLRLGARILQMYAAQPHVVSHALELMQQARSGESNSRSTPLDARCSLPHLLACSLAALPDLSSPSALSSLLPALSLSVCAIPFLSRVTSKVAPRVWPRPPPPSALSRTTLSTSSAAAFSRVPTFAPPLLKTSRGSPRS